MSSFDQATAILKNMIGVEFVVEAINEISEYDVSAEDLAAVYAIECISDNDSVRIRDLELQLKFLSSNGARFDFSRALNIAERLLHKQDSSL